MESIKMEKNTAKNIDTIVITVLRLLRHIFLQASFKYMFF
ncbi:hypothetical protein M23134_01612 [Microscilla marina ATCC 23134]|uniref:Uncharacterized protein n=1 Tax=Microscilla marina ATCC 23134 TaxID=313606 RepID=A1ZTN0_MICM2|nr:hypothetical protein M23134_01612 [Microscilla marina ATCC 23134]